MPAPASTKILATNPTVGLKLQQDVATLWQELLEYLTKPGKLGRARQTLWPPQKYVKHSSSRTRQSITAHSASKGGLHALKVNLQSRMKTRAIKQMLSIKQITPQKPGRSANCGPWRKIIQTK